MRRSHYYYLQWFITTQHSKKRTKGYQHTTIQNKTPLESTNIILINDLHTTTMQHKTNQITAQHIRTPYKKSLAQNSIIMIINIQHSIHHNTTAQEFPFATHSRKFFTHAPTQNTPIQPSVSPRHCT